MDSNKVVSLRTDAAVTLAQQFGALLHHAMTPISVAQLAALAEVTEREVQWALDVLASDLARVGIELRREGGKVELVVARDIAIIKGYRRINKDGLLETIEEYLHAKELHGMRASSVKGQRLFLCRFILELGKLVEDITTRDVRKFLMDEAARGNARSTIATKISRLKSFFTWLEIEDYIDKDPMRKIEKPKANASQPKHLSHEQIEQLREVAKGIDRVLLETLYCSGLRVSEAVSLNWNEVDFNAKLIQVLDGKGGKDRVVPLSTKASLILQRYRDGRKDKEPCAFRSRNRRRMSKETIERRIKELGVTAQLGVKVTPHRLRHSLATHLLDAGMKMEEVQMVLGHSSVATTEIYAKSNFANVEHSYRRLMP